MEKELESVGLRISGRSGSGAEAEERERQGKERKKRYRDITELSHVKHYGKTGSGKVGHKDETGRMITGNKRWKMMA